MGRMYPVVAGVLVVAACSSGSVATTTSGATSSTAIATTAADSTTTTAPRIDCGDTFPVFLPYGEPIEGAEGQGPLGSAPGEGEVARWWQVDEELGVYVSARWPVMPADPASPAAPGTVVSETSLEDGVALIVVVDAPPGCEFMNVEVRGTGRLEPVVDQALAISEDLRSIAELEAFLNPLPPERLVIPPGPAVRVVEQFLEAAASARWDVAAAALYNEGVAEAVTDRLEVECCEIEEALAAYCSSALCAAPYRVTAVVSEEFRAEVTVEFDDDGEWVEWRAPLGQFEGILSLGDLPPRGTTVARPSLSQRLFGGDANFGAIWYDAVQIFTPAEVAWARWWVARFGHPDLLNRWGVTDYAGTIDVLDLLGEFEPERVAAEELWLAGSGTVDDREVVFAASDGTLFELDVATLELQRVLDVSAREAFVGVVSAAGSTIAVQVGVGDSSWIEFYDPAWRPIGSTKGAEDPFVFVALDPEGATAAMGIETTLHVIDTVGLYDVAGGALVATWTYAGEGTLGEVEFDGRFIVAPIVGAPDGLPAVLVVDTDSGGVRVVPTSARIDFG